MYLCVKMQADGAYQAHRNADAAGLSDNLVSCLRADGVQLEPAACWRLVGRHDNLLRSGLRPRSLHPARPSTSEYSGTALPYAACTVDSARLGDHQHLLDGHAVAGHLDSLCRLDGIR